MNWQEENKNCNDLDDTPKLTQGLKCRTTKQNLPLLLLLFIRDCLALDSELLVLYLCNAPLCLCY